MVASILDADIIDQLIDRYIHQQQFADCILYRLKLPTLKLNVAGDINQYDIVFDVYMLHHSLEH